MRDKWIARRMVAVAVGLVVVGIGASALHSWWPGDPTLTFSGTVEGYSPMAAPAYQHACVANIETPNGSLYTVIAQGAEGGSYCEVLYTAGRSRYREVVVQANLQSFYAAPDYYLMLPLVVRVDNK